MPSICLVMIKSIKVFSADFDAHSRQSAPDIRDLPPYFDTANNFAKEGIADIRDNHRMVRDSLRLTLRPIGCGK